MVKICYVQHASETLFIKKIAEYLKLSDVEFKIVCKSKNAYEEYLKDGFESFYISEIFNTKDYFSKKELDDLETKYNTSSMEDIINSDVQLKCFFKKDKLKARQLIGKAYIFWENFFDQNKIDYIITREIATFSARTAYNVAIYRKISLSQITGGPGDNYFILSDVGRTSVWSELLSKLQDEKKIVDSEQRNVVHNFIKERIPNTNNKMILRFVPISFIKSIKNLLGMLIRDTALNRKNDPIKVASLCYGRYLLSKRLKWRFITQKIFKYDLFDKDKKFIYFPIYSGDETGYLVDDYYWAKNQILLIESIAKSLPTGYFLYIKEHPLNPGYITYSELKYLRKIPNIKILLSSISSQELIEKSKAVFVLQGTVGWEAFLSKKPVINLGKTFYSYSSLVYKIENISNISDIINEVIKYGSNMYKEKEEEWLWFIYCVISSCNKGSIVRLKPPYGFDTDPDNIKNVSDAILKKIKKDLEKPL